MHCPRLSVGLGAWDVAGCSTSSVAVALVAASASIALVVSSAIVGVLAMHCTGLPVSLGAWDVAHDAATCNIKQV